MYSTPIILLTTSGSFVRLDKYLVEEGFFESRNRAAEAIKAGQVRVAGQTARASMRVDPSVSVEVIQEKFYVSRAARKLEGYLKSYPLSLSGRRALDVGSSTGGFTQILLEQGAARVDCVDVGRDQLHVSVRRDPRVGVYEQTDIRDFHPDTRYDVIVSDVSFISLLYILDSIERLAADGADIILLFKPQFEVGRTARRDRRGVVTDEAAIEEAKQRFESAAHDLSWQMIRKVPSTLSGKEGNLEWVYHFNNTPQTPS